MADQPRLPSATTTDAASPLMIGLSYSLNVDGSPGFYNEEIARLMQEDYTDLAGDHPNRSPRLGMQWEIWDALDGHELQKSVPLEHVVSPPPFSEADILNPDDKQLKRLLEFLERRSTTSPGIAAALNEMLDDRSFAKRFRHLELASLQRGGQRFIWIEERRMPSEFPLKRFQAQRVNRLIVERLCPKGVKVGEYLPARQVFRKLFESVTASGGVVDEVWIYAHPEHFSACRRDGKAIAADLKMSIGRIVDRVADRWSAPLWDEGTAQHWCRDFKRWRLYQADMREYYEGPEP